MTNFDYIKEHLTEMDLVGYELPYHVKFDQRTHLFSDKIYDAWNTWAESFSSNHGNMAKGNHNGKIISENPSIWAWETWLFPDGTKRKMGRTSINSFLVWLSLQYNSKEWEGDADG